jgi:hypothetical protein
MHKIFTQGRKKENKNRHSDKQFCALVCLSSEKTHGVSFFQFLANLLLVLWVEREAFCARFSRARQQKVKASGAAEEEVTRAAFGAQHSSIRSHETSTSRESKSMNE